MVLVLILASDRDKWQAVVNMIMNLLLPLLRLLLLLLSSPPPPMAVQSTAVLHLLNELIVVTSVFFYLSFQFVILHLLISVCTRFHHLFFGCPVS